MRVTTNFGSGDMVKLPLVSVIITNRNYERYVISAIKSVHSQSYKNIECIIIDDCSDDNSFAVITDFIASQGDDRFRCIRLGKNLGQMAAFKAGLENSNGLFIASLDADDIWFTGFVEAHIMAHLNTSYSAGFTASDTMQIDEEGNLLESTFHMHGKCRSEAAKGSHNIIPKDAVPSIVGGQLTFITKNDESGLLYLDRSARGWSFVAMSSFMFRRAVIEMIVPNDLDRVRICADYYLARFSHSLSGSLLISQAHSAFRMHKRNHFSKNSVLGGPHGPGQFAPEMIKNLERLIADHLLQNIEHFETALGIEFCLKLIQMIYQNHDLVQAVKHSPKLRGLLEKTGHAQDNRRNSLLKRIWRARPEAHD